MHVLYLMPADGFGGAERQGILHIRWLRQLGHFVTAVVGRSTPMVQGLGDSDDGGNTLWLDDFPPTPSGDDATLDAVHYPARWLGRIHRAACRIEPLVKSRQIEVVVANRTFAWVLAAVLHRRTGIPFVLRSGSRPRGKSLARGMSLLPLLDLEPVLFVSNCRSVEECFRPYVIAPKMILPNAVDTTQFRPRDATAACQHLGLDHARPRVGLAIRPSADKGIELLCEVVNRTRLTQPTVEFVIAGDCSERKRYTALVKQRGLGETLRFLGHIDDVAGLYAACDIVMLTSPKNSIEGSPNALLEAMACGKPIVATAVGGVPELVRDGVDGFLVSEKEPSRAASSIDRLLRDRTLREHMGMAGRTRAEQDHVPQAIVQRLADRIGRHVLTRDEYGGYWNAR